MAKLEVVYGLFFLATLGLQICSSAVICPPCEQGEFCYASFGMCLPCKDYCTDGDGCRKECSHKKLSPTTIPPTTTEKSVSTPNRTTFHPITSRTSTEASDLVVTSSIRTVVQSGGGGPNTALTVFLCISLVGMMVLGLCYLKHCKTIKMPSMCCFKTRDFQISINIDPSPANERHSRNLRTSCETGLNIWSPNPLVNLTPVVPQTTTGYTAVQVEDETSFINQPGPSGLDSSRSRRPTAETASPANPEHSGPPAPGDADPPFQSARIQPVNAPLQERERLLGAVPTEPQSMKQKTPEIHRKITDGTHEGHVCTVTGASQFIPPPFVHEDLHWNRDSGHGD